MNGLPYYKAYPRDFIEGTIGMPFELKCAYRVVLDLIYMQGGNLPDDARYISGLLGCTVRKWNSLRFQLVKMGKLEITGEFLTNYRAIIELETLRKLQDNQREKRARPNKNKEIKSPRCDQPEPDTEPDKKETKVSQKEPPKFEEVWDAWPQPGRTRSSRKQVQAAYAGVLKAYDHAEVMRAVGMYLRSPDAKKDGGQFVPALHRWLRDERFTAWLEAATPKAVEPVGPVDLPDTPEGRFLTECREDGASERDLRAWSGRFVIEEINGLSAAVTQDDDAALREVFAKTLKRHGMTAMHSLRAKRIKEKAA